LTSGSFRTTIVMAGSRRWWFQHLPSCMELATFFKTNQIWDSHDS
jgi:hypothetical protein